MPSEPIDIDHSFTTTIGIEVKGSMWACVPIPELAAFEGSKRGLRIDARVDDVELTSVGLLPTGTGGLMLSLNAGIRKRLGKDIGDPVDVLERRRVA